MAYINRAVDKREKVCYNDANDDKKGGFRVKVTFGKNESHRYVGNPSIRMEGMIPSC